MCTCQQTNADGQPIGVLFENNKRAIARVFVNYGVGNLPVTVDGAAAAAHDLGEGFINDVASAMHGSYSGVDGSKPAAVQTAAQALGLLGLISGGIGEFIKGYTAQPGETANDINADGGAAPTTTTDTNPKPDDKKSLNTTQWVLIGVLVVSVVGLIVYAVTREK